MTQVYEKRIVLYVMAFCFFISCNKHNDLPTGGNMPGNPPATVRVKSLNGNVFFYDSSGRLIKETYSNSIPVRTEYSYTDTTMTGIDYDQQAPSGSGLTYYIGANGLAYGEKYIIAPDISPLIYSFTYNDERQLLSQISSQVGSAGNFNRTDYYYSNHNLDSTKTYFIPGNILISQGYFTYYTNKPNTLNNETFGVSFIGAGSANLLKKASNKDASGIITSTEYAYEFDAANRPIKRHTTITDGTAGDDYSYTYY